MGAFSVHGSISIRNPKTGRTSTEQYPTNRKGQAGTISGVDPEAMTLLRGKTGKGDVTLSAAAARKIGKAIADGSRVSAYEKSIYNAMIAAGQKKQVSFTDETGHWRTLKLAPGASAAFKEAVKGTHFAPGAK
jgi:hypothetical protein